MDGPGRQKRILVVEDEKEVRDSICSTLRSHGFMVVSAGDGQSALQEVERLSPDLVLTDLFMPELDGIELIGRLCETAPALPIVAMSTRFKPLAVDYIEIAMKLGAVAGFYKPLDEDRLLEVLDFALSRGTAPAQSVARATRVA